MPILTIKCFFTRTRGGYTTTIYVLHSNSDD